MIVKIIGAGGGGWVATASNTCDGYNGGSGSTIEFQFDIDQLQTLYFAIGSGGKADGTAGSPDGGKGQQTLTCANGGGGGLTGIFT